MLYRRRSALPALAALVLIPAAIAVVHAQVVRCYIEVCVPMSSGGQSCYEKPVTCPKET